VENESEGFVGRLRCMRPKRLRFISPGREKFPGSVTSPQAVKLWMNLGKEE
jgi:hypothetical protein